MKIKQSDLCMYCGEIETIQHFFFDCITVKSLWSDIEGRIQSIINEHIFLSATDVLLGLGKKTRFSHNTMNTLNLLILIGKATISKVKYGKHKNFLVIFEREMNIRKLNL